MCFVWVSSVGLVSTASVPPSRLRSVFLTIRYDDHDACLSLIRLNQKVKGTRLKFKDDSMVLQLEKEDAEVKWYGGVLRLRTRLSRTHMHAQVRPPQDNRAWRR